MKLIQQQPKQSRKKLPSETTHIQNKPHICTPNLKFDFLTNDPGKSLLQLRKSQIDSIVDNIKILLSSQPMQQKKSKRIMLILGTPGTGKTSSIKQSLQILNDYCLQNKKQFKNLHNIQILTFNANSFRKCEQIKKQMLKIKQGKQYEGRIRCNQTIVNVKGCEDINILYVQQIDQIFSVNSDELLQQFVENLYICVEDKEKNKVTKNKIVNKYILIGGSNSINLDQILIKKVTSLKNQQIFTLIFKPYSPQNLLRICQNKLTLIKQEMNIDIKIERKVLKYIITKLAENKRDDTRNVIQIIKQFVLFAQSNSQVQQMLSQSKQPSIKIGLEQMHGIAKIKEMLNNHKIEIIGKLNYKQQIILTILYKYLKDSDDLQMPYLQIVEQFKKIQKNAGIVAYEDVKMATTQLQTYGCIRIKTNTRLKKLTKNNTPTSVLLRVSFSDIESSLSSNPILAPYLQ